jgi:hypothetical protein
MAQEILKKIAEIRGMEVWKLEKEYPREKLADVKWLQRKLETAQDKAHEDAAKDEKKHRANLLKNLREEGLAAPRGAAIPELQKALIDGRKAKNDARHVENLRRLISKEGFAVPETADIEALQAHLTAGRRKRSLRSVASRPAAERVYPSSEPSAEALKARDLAARAAALLEAGIRISKRANEDDDDDESGYYEYWDESDIAYGESRLARGETDAVIRSNRKAEHIRKNEARIAHYKEIYGERWLDILESDAHTSMDYRSIVYSEALDALHYLEEKNRKEKIS